MEKDLSENVIIKKFVDDLNNKGYISLSEDKLKFGSLLNKQIKSFNEKESVNIPLINKNGNTDELKKILFQYNDKYFDNEKFIEIKALEELRSFIKNDKSINLDAFASIRRELYSYISNENTNYLGNWEILYRENEVKIHIIKTLSDFMGILKKYQNETKLYYRGQQNLNWKNEPSIFRFKNWIEHEKDFIEKLQIHNSEDFINAHATIEKLTKMQHYQLPTRLLDITENPYIALYFACEQTNEKYNSNKEWGEVTLFSPSEKCEEKYFDSNCVSIISNISMMEKEFSTDKINKLRDQVCLEKNYISNIEKKDVEKNIFVHVKRDNKRIINQQGLFLLFGMDGVKEKPHSVDDAYFKKDNKKIVFVMKEKIKILEELKNLNINKGFIYPEIDDYATYLKNDVYGE